MSPWPSGSLGPPAAAVDEPLRGQVDAYLAALLRPDAREAIRVSAEFIRGCDDIPAWWQRVIQPALYAVGERWAASGSVPAETGPCRLIIELTICTAWLGLAA